MEQLLLHLFGDYISQTEWMAREKVKKNRAAIAHASIYTLPFIFLTQSIYALMVIGITHYLIDRYRLVRYLIFFKNKITDWNLKWKDCSSTGFHKDTPPWLSVWLMIIIDNTIHLIVNYMAIKYL